MEIVVLGSGTATPSLERSSSALAIRGAGKQLLVDIGAGTIRRLCEARIDTKTVDAILITHFHPDHVSDLVPFLFASNYAFGPVREEPFYLVGPLGLREYYRALTNVYGEWIVPRDGRLKIRELAPDRNDTLLLGDVRILSCAARHHFPALSYRIEAGGVSVTVSGDTDLSDDLVQLSKNTDCLICECSMPDGMKVAGHMVPSEAGSTAQAAGAGKLVLTHMYPPCEDVDVAARAGALFHGEVLKARDLMTIVI